MGKVNLHDTVDVVIWTQEWLKTIKKNPSIPTDEGTMIGWFANAIMAGYNYARREAQQLESITPAKERQDNEKT